MKTCIKCKVEKLEDEFHWKKKDIKRQNTCKECSADKRRFYYERNKDKYIAKAAIINAKLIKRNQDFIIDYLLNKSCLSCSENNIIVLDFDHREPESKSDTISKMIRDGRSIESIELEIQKCDILCANCHRIKTAEESSSFKHKYLLEAQRA